MVNELRNLVPVWSPQTQIHPKTWCINSSGAECLYLPKKRATVDFSGEMAKPNSKEVACPARFERATYALEALKMRLNNTKNNGIKLLAFGVASTPRSVGLSGSEVSSAGG